MTSLYLPNPRAQAESVDLIPPDGLPLGRQPRSKLLTYTEKGCKWPKQSVLQ